MFSSLAFPFKAGFSAPKSLSLVLAASAIFASATVPPAPAQARGVTAASVVSGSARQSDAKSEAPAATPLEPAMSITRELSGGQEHGYQLVLAEGQYASVVVRQRGLDVVARLLGPLGQALAEFDSEIRLQGEERVELVAETGGSYRLIIAAKQQAAPAGGYVIEFAERRAATEKDRSLQEARKLYAESIGLRRAGKYDEAFPPGQKAMAIQEALLGPEHPDVATSLNNLGETYRQKGDYLKAEPLHRRALEIRLKGLGPEHPYVAYSLHNLAIIAEVKGDYTGAKSLYQRALTIKEKAQGPEHPDVATSLNNLAALYVNTGDFVEAERLYLRALAIKEKASGPEHPSVASTLNDLGVLYRGKGDYARAEQLQQRALAIREKALGPDHPQVAITLNNLGNAYVSLGDLVKAEPVYQRALEIRVKVLGPEHPLVATSLNNLAVIHEGKGDNAGAESLYRRALEIRIKALGPEHRDVGASLNNLAQLYHRLGNYAEAESLYQRALKIRERTQGRDNPKVAELLNDLARLYAAEDDFPQAIATQSRASAITEQNLALNLVTGSERQKLAYLSSLTEMADRCLSLHLRSAPEDPQALALAITTVLQRKGRALDYMSDSLAALRHRFNAEDQMLLDQLNDTTAQLSSLAFNEPQRTTPGEYQKQIQALEERREKLENEISSRSAGFYVQSQPVTLAAIQSAIPPDAALIELAVYRPYDPKANCAQAYGEPRYVAYVVRKQGEARWAELGEAKAIDRAVGEWRRALRDSRRRDVRQLARAVDEKVMRPVRSLLGDATHLLISPDGALNLIPFEALVDEQNRYLVERFFCTYLTSGRDLLRLQVARASKSAPLVLADPLFGEPASLRAKPRGNGLRQSAGGGTELAEMYFAPIAGTAGEALTIRSLFTDVQVLTGARATESSLKQAAAPRLLHIATHGFFLSDAPALPSTANEDKVRAISAGARSDNPLLRSGVALAGANLHRGGGDDGILTALEATGLNLWGTKLVTLSACDTGIGEVKNGEGVYGLRRAFVLAGAETLVMSLWPVSDYMTRETMSGYYRNLKQGEGRGAALRQVQLAMLKRKGREHPFYWASFIQSGEWAALDGKR